MFGILFVNIECQKQKEPDNIVKLSEEKKESLGTPPLKELKTQKVMFLFILRM